MQTPSYPPMRSNTAQMHSRQSEPAPEYTSILINQTIRSGPAQMHSMQSNFCIFSYLFYYIIFIKTPNTTWIV